MHEVLGVVASDGEVPLVLLLVVDDVNVEVFVLVFDHEVDDCLHALFGYVRLELDDEKI